MHRRGLGLITLGLISLLAVAAVGAGVGQSHGLVYAGVVIDLSGAPIADATIRIAGDGTTSHADGTFELRTDAREGWVRAQAAGFLPRLRPATPGPELVLRLTPDDGHTISLAFGGDVMFGRRFFDPNEDGNPADGRLQPGSTVADYASLLDGVAPALSAADVSVVNMETPLLGAPFVDPTKPRPSAFHPAKEFVFASLPVAAQALKAVGVDVTGIGNNHLYDGLDAGVRETMNALDAAGFGAGSGRTGGGMTEATAWAPAMLDARGTRVAVLACTTIDGAATPPIYVAEGTTKGGAARCTEDSVRAAVIDARSRADLVVLMIHGGYEYDRAPTERIRALSAVARASGAALVVNHHPHVVGGFDASGGTLTAWTIGNLLFDQDVWPTFEAYLLTVHVRDGVVIRGIVDPLILNDYLPQPIGGELAVHVARDAAGWAPGPFVIEGGAVEIADPATLTEVRHTESVQGAGGSIFRLGGADRLDPQTRSGEIEAGRDLLWTGGFEDDVLDGVRDAAPLWLPDAPGRERRKDAAWRGDSGVRLERAGSNSADVILSPIHRALVTPGTRLSLVAMVRQSDGARGRVQLSWYNDLRGASSEVTVADAPAGDGWQTVRIDVTVPENAVAVLPIFRLQAPTAGQVTLDVDDVRLIAWGSAEAATAATDYLRIRGSATFDAVAATLPGFTGVPGVTELVAGDESINVAPPRALPPGPSLDPAGDQ